MKILQLLDEPWDSGITAYALQIADLLHRGGETVVVGVRAGKEPERLARALKLTTAVYDSAPSLRSILNSQRWDVINVHTGRAHTWSVVSNLIFSVGPRRAARPPIIRTRGDARELSVNIATRLLYRCTAGVIAASDHIRNQYETEFGMPDERARTIYPSIEADGLITPAPLNRVGIVGRLDEVKGHAILLEAAVRVLEKRKNVTFHIAGKEAGVTQRLLRNQADALGIPASALDFAGYVPSARDFMRGCTVGVIASLGSEEISRACLEWMSVGRPVVGTVVGCVSELIEPEETGLLVSPNDAPTMAAAILRLFEDETLARTLGRNAHAKINRQFDAATELRKTLDFYRWAMERRRPWRQGGR